MEIDGRPWLDGGLADPIPIRKAISDGAKEIVCVLNEPAGQTCCTGYSPTEVGHFPLPFDEGILMAAIGHIAKPRIHDAETIIPLPAFDPYPNSTAAVGADIVALLRELDAGPAHLVGNSMGAGAAVWAAAEAAESLIRKSFEAAEGNAEAGFGVRGGEGLQHQ